MKWDQALRDALNLDEFEDVSQYEGTNQGYLYPDILSLARMFMHERPDVGDHANTNALEIGPGTIPISEQSSMGLGWDWRYCEPSVSRSESLRVVLGGDEPNTVATAFAEDMPWGSNMFGLVVMFNGFFQVRSDYEAILEINRVLSHRGRFIFNLQTGDDVDIIVGRVLGPRNVVRMLRQFGFDVLCQWEGLVNRDHRVAGGRERQAFICVEKVRTATAGDLNQPQLIPYVPTDPDPMDRELYIGKNVDLDGREGYLA